MPVVENQETTNHEQPETGVLEVAELIEKNAPDISPHVQEPSGTVQDVQGAEKVDQEKDRPWWAEKKDKHGRHFDPNADPQIHITDKNGDPVIGKKYGTIKIKPGKAARKGPATNSTNNPGSTVGDIPGQAAGADPGGDQAKASGADLPQVSNEQLAQMAVGGTFMALGWLLGEEYGRPIVIDGYNELEAYQSIWKAKLDQLNDGDLTLNQTIGLTLAVSVMVRMRQPPARKTFYARIKKGWPTFKKISKKVKSGIVKVYVRLAGRA